MTTDKGGFLVPMQRLASFMENIMDDSLEMYQATSEWEVDGKVTAWAFRKKRIRTMEYIDTLAHMHDDRWDLIRMEIEPGDTLTTWTFERV